MTLRPEPYGHLTTERVFRGLAALADEARARGVAMSTLAMAWLLHQPRVDAIVIGPRREAHMTDALAAVGVQLDRDDVDRLARIVTGEQAAAP
jgi:aryl-alcohol dehydrogenase-like predicted oxidoreductase